MENNAVLGFFVKPKDFCKMPADGFSLAVLIGCEPNLLGSLCCRLKLADYIALIFRNLIFRFKCIEVYTEILLLKVADVAKA